MAITIKEKQHILELLQNHVAPQKSVVILSTNNSKSSLDSTKNFGFRSSARKKGIIIKVVKNTLISKIFDTPDLVGQTLLAFLENKEESDEVAVPKSIVSIIKDDYDDNLQIIGSIVNGEYYDSTKTITLSQTSTKLESLSMVAGLLNSITARIAIATKEVPSSVARGVSEISKQLH